MLVQQLGEFEERHHDATHRVIVKAADLTVLATATAQTIQLLPVKAGTVWTFCSDKLVTPFQDASDSGFNTCAATIGDGGAVARGMASQELNVNGTEVLYKANPNTLPYAYLVDDTIDLVVGSQTGKALNDIDVGELHIYLKLANLNSIQV